MELRYRTATLKQIAISTQNNSLHIADYNQQHGRREKGGILGVKEEADEDSYQKVFNAAAETYAHFCLEVIRFFHKFPGKTLRDGERRPTFVKVLDEQTKLRLMSCKYKETDAVKRILLNDHLTPPQERDKNALHRRADVAAVKMVNETLVDFEKKDKSNVFWKIFPKLKLEIYLHLFRFLLPLYCVFVGKTTYVSPDAWKGWIETKFCIQISQKRGRGDVAINWKIYMEMFWRSC